MRKFVVGVVVGFMVSWGVGFAASGLEHNGVFWGKLSSPAKTSYINGYADAMQVSVGKLDSLNIAADLFHWKGANKIIRQLSHELTIGEANPNEAVKKLDALYSNPKYSELDLGQALQLLSAQTSAAPAADSSFKDAPSK